MINNCKNIFMSSDGYNLSIERNSFNLMSAKIYNFDCLVIGNGQPISAKGYRFDIMPDTFPGLKIIMI